MPHVAEKTPRNAAEAAQGVWKPALREAAWTFSVAAALLIVVYALAFKGIHPEFERFMEQDAKPLTAAGKDLIPVSVGKGRKLDSQYIIEAFNGDEAILVLPRSFQAEDYPFIKVNLSGFNRYSEAKILWQQVGDLTTHALELNRSGDEVTQIAMVHGGEAFSGRIESIALLFYDGPAHAIDNNNGRDISIESIEFRPFSVSNVIEQIFEDWKNPPLWTGRSSNVVRGGHANVQLLPTLVINLTIVLGAIITASFRAMRFKLDAKNAHAPISAVLITLCLYGWTTNEFLRWHWRVDQVGDSLDRYLGYALPDKIKRSDLRCIRFSQSCKGDLLPYF